MKTEWEMGGVEKKIRDRKEQLDKLYFLVARANWGVYFPRKLWHDSAFVFKAGASCLQLARQLARRPPPVWSETGERRRQQAQILVQHVNPAAWWKSRWQEHQINNAFNLIHNSGCMIFKNSSCELRSINFNNSSLNLSVKIIKSRTIKIIISSEMLLKTLNNWAIYLFNVKGGLTFKIHFFQVFLRGRSLQQQVGRGFP